MEARLSQLWALIVEEYIRVGCSCQVGQITLNMFSDSSGRTTHEPELSNRVKGAETRNLVPVILEVFSHLRRPGNIWDEHIREVLQSLTTYYKILSECKYLLSLPTQAQRTLEASLWNLNRHYSSLTALARGQGLKRWGVTIKFHMALHIAIQSRWTNPSLTWTYVDEDFMGIVKGVGESCAAATSAHLLVPKLVQRYAVGMDVRLAFAIDLNAMD